MKMPLTGKKPFLTWILTLITTQMKDDYQEWYDMFITQMEKAAQKMKKDKDKVISVSGSQLDMLYEAHIDDDYESDLILNGE